MKVHGDVLSGNCYKVKLTAALLGIEHEWVAIDILAGETRTPSFLALNPNGKIPLLELDDGRCLAESNAIIDYLATGTRLLPDDAFARAKVLEWQFFEQYSHEPCIAVARFINVYLGLPESRRAEYEALQPKGHAALGVLERQLRTTAFLVGPEPSVADISLYAYTHVAGEGGFELAAYPGIRAWIERIQALPGHVSMG